MRSFLFLSIFFVSSANFCKADVIWTLESLDSAGNAKTEFAVGEDGFIEVSATLSGTQLTANAESYQLVIQTPTSGVLSAMDAIETPAGDIHSVDPNTVRPSADPSQMVVGELHFGAFAPPPASTVPLFRIPFTMEASSGLYTYSSLDSAVSSASSSWNGQESDSAPPLAQTFGSVTISAVPEPSGLGLLGLVGVAAAMRRRRSA